MLINNFFKNLNQKYVECKINIKLQMHNNKFLNSYNKNLKD